MADCETCGFNIKGKCRLPGEEVLPLDAIDMEEDCSEWCAKGSKENEKALAQYKDMFPHPTIKDLHKALGTTSKKAAAYMLAPPATVMSTTGTELGDQDVQNIAINNAKTILSAINPQDELEGMLATQMLGIHDIAMKKMMCCVSDDRLDAVNLKINQITKLSRTFIAQMEALNKHRGKGQQKITVEHVTVNKGGQAIVGNVEKGGKG